MIMMMMINRNTALNRDVSPIRNKSLNETYP